ncbi:MAG: NADPH:quinone oxidoreductase family protein [Myxococcaceae bacterium]|nr:NADPH:quinone oxidoreductase family protein [Myxococcaceae bacterium]
MRAVRVHVLEGPKSLKVDELPTPEPSDGEVRIDVRAAGVNFPDVLLSYGKYQFKPEPPFVPGGEAAGVVSAVGPGVTTVKKGDRVAATMVNGAFAESVVVSELACVKVPEAVSFEAAAAATLTYGTTIHALVDRAKLQAGETLLVLGAAGGVGVAAIQLGKVLGARVIAAASGAEKLTFCRAQGADEVIDYGKEDLKDRTKALTNGDGANVIYDPVGGRYSEQALRAIAWEGRHLVVGFAAGEIPKMPLNLLLLKGCQVLGVFWGQFAMREIDKNRANIAQVLGWVAEGKLKPQIDATLKFAQATEALERLERRAVKGKVVLVP